MMAHVACYLRVSTDDQSLDRQRTATAEYAQHEFDVDLTDLTFYQDKATGTKSIATATATSSKKSARSMPSSSIASLGFHAPSAISIALSTASSRRPVRNSTSSRRDFG